jgi:hypothetical protein
VKTSGEKLDSGGLDVTTDEKTRPGAGSIRGDQLGKIFIVVGENVHECLICEGVFTRQAASEHSAVHCMPRIMKTGRK